MRLLSQSSWVNSFAAARCAAWLMMFASFLSADSYVMGPRWSSSTVAGMVRCDARRWLANGRDDAQVFRDGSSGKLQLNFELPSQIAFHLVPAGRSGLHTPRLHMWIKS